MDFINAASFQDFIPASLQIIQFRIDGHKYTELLFQSHECIFLLFLSWDDNLKAKAKKALCTEGLTHYKFSQNPSKINNVSETQVMTKKNG